MERTGVERNTAPAGGRVRARRTAKLSEVVAREIVRDLRNLPPSTMLPSEAIMLEKYGVGRASLREALRLLEVQGLIVIKPGPGGGPMVAQVDSAHYGRISSLYYHMSGATYRDIAEALLALEPVIARTVAERHDTHDIAALREALDQMGSRGPDAYERYVKGASSFHAMLAGMSGNPVLTLSTRSLQEVLIERVRDHFPAETQDWVEREHAGIILAIIKGDPARAETLMRKHMQEYIRHGMERYADLLSETVDWH